MANTRLTTPGELARSLRELSRSTGELAKKMDAEEKFWQSEAARGEHALTLKTRVDNMFEGVNADMRRLGQELGNEGTAPLLPTVFAPQWRAGVTAGLDYFTTGAGNPNVFTTAGVTIGGVLIAYLDVSPNYDIFVGSSGAKLNDVIRISNCSDTDHNGIKTVRWDAVAKGNGGTDYGLTQGDFSSSGSDWTAGTDWTVNTGSAVYSAASGTTARTVTQALANTTTTGLYVVQFDLSWVSGSGTVKVDIGGNYYWQITADASGDTGTYNLVTNAPSTTPTLTFTATRAADTFSVTIDNVYVYGYQGLMVTEAFPSREVGKKTVITLTQTAA